MNEDPFITACIYAIAAGFLAFGLYCMALAIAHH